MIKNHLYLVLYERTHKVSGKEYKAKAYMTGYLVTGKEGVYFEGCTFGKINGAINPYCDLIELTEQEFNTYCTIVKALGEII